MLNPEQKYARQSCRLSPKKVPSERRITVRPREKNKVRIASVSERFVCQSEWLVSDGTYSVRVRRKTRSRCDRSSDSNKRASNMSKTTTSVSKSNRHAAQAQDLSVPTAIVRAYWVDGTVCLEKKIPQNKTVKEGIELIAEELILNVCNTYDCPISNPDNVEAGIAHFPFGVSALNICGMCCETGR